MKQSERTKIFEAIGLINRVYSLKTALAKDLIKAKHDRVPELKQRIRELCIDIEELLKD